MANDTISLHPAVLARYEQQLVHLQDALSKGINAGDSEAAEAIRDLVETVTVFRDPSRPGGVTVEIAGRSNALLGEQAFPNKVRGVWGKMVAGEGLDTTSQINSTKTISYRHGQPHVSCVCDTGASVFWQAHEG